MLDYAIKVSNLSKKYSSTERSQTLIGNILKKKKKKDVWALRNINFTVKKGEEFGIIGLNGSGKTTLLEIIAGITTPTSGELNVNGKIVSLINLNSGFHPDLSGRENLYLNAMLLGMKKAEIRKNFIKIVKFADIGSFINTPLYTYSDGMKLRLGFSIAIHADPDILVLDEAFSFGDYKFMNKAVKRMKNLLKKGMTIILATHDLDMLEKIYNRVLWLDAGRTKMLGLANKTVSIYRKEIRS